MKRWPPKPNSLFPFSFLLHHSICRPKHRDNTPPYALPQPQVLSIITSTAVSNYWLISVSAPPTQFQHSWAHPAMPFCIWINFHCSVCAQQCLPPVCWCLHLLSPRCLLASALTSCCIAGSASPCPTWRGMAWILWIHLSDQADVCSLARTLPWQHRPCVPSDAVGEVACKWRGDINKTGQWGGWMMQHAME